MGKVRAKDISPSKRYLWIQNNREWKRSIVNPIEYRLYKIEKAMASLHKAKRIKYANLERQAENLYQRLQDSKDNKVVYHQLVIQLKEKKPQILLKDWMLVVTIMKHIGLPIAATAIQCAILCELHPIMERDWFTTNFKYGGEISLGRIPVALQWYQRWIPGGVKSNFQQTCNVVKKRLYYNILFWGKTFIQYDLKGLGCVEEMTSRDMKCLKRMNNSWSRALLNRATQHFYMIRTCAQDLNQRELNILDSLTKRKV